MARHAMLYGAAAIGALLAAEPALSAPLNPDAQQGALIPVALRTDQTVQAGPFNAPPPAAPAGAAPQAEPLTAGTVVVTGTRIVRNGYSAPTPVTVATVSNLLET